MLPLWHSLFAQAIDKSPAETGAGPQAPVETDGYEDVDEEGYGYGYGYGEDWDDWWSYMKKEEEDNPEETPVKDVEDLGGDHSGHGFEEHVEVQVEEEPPEPPKKKVRTPELDDEDSTWQGWQQSYADAGSSRDTKDEWWQGGGEPWKNTWWWDNSWSHSDWRGRHDHPKTPKKGKGKGKAPHGSGRSRARSRGQGPQNMANRVLDVADKALNIVQGSQQGKR